MARPHPFGLLLQRFSTQSVAKNVSTTFANAIARTFMNNAG
jgi:hypothetical protein